MTPERQQAAIAEVMPKGFLEGLRWNYGGQWIVFDPLNDLNAMHEAESILTDGKQIEDYEAELWKATNFARPSHRAVICATAAQRAEAFCRTVPSKQNSSLSIWEWHERTTSMSATH